LRLKGSAFLSVLAIQLLLGRFCNQPFNCPRFVCELHTNSGRATGRAVNLAKIIRANEQPDCLAMIADAAATCPASESVWLLAVTGFETVSLSRAGRLILWHVKRLLSDIKPNLRCREPTGI
jgi:hypothetical protein